MIIDLQVSPCAASNHATNMSTDLHAKIYFGEVVVAQLAERLLTIPEDPGSNPVIGNFY